MTKQSVYGYIGFNSKGLRIKGKCRAFSKEEVLKQLHRQDIQIINIRKHYFFNLFNKKPHKHDVIFFLQQISILLSSGVSLLQAINILEQDNTKKTLQNVITACKDHLTQGQSFHSAIAKYPHIFGNLTINLINISEQTGTLTSTLTKLSHQLEKLAKSKKNMQLVLYYPVGVLSLSITIIAILLFFIVPQFTSLFQTFNAKLPWSTQLVIHLSQTLQNNATALLTFTFLSAIGFTTLLKKSKRLGNFLERLKLKTPFLGKVLQKTIIARLVQSLATTLSAGLPLTEALTLLTSITNHYIFTEAILTIRDEVTGGASLYQAMKMTKQFPASVIQMIAIGEETATLDKMLLKIAIIHEKEVEEAIEKLIKLLEPIMLLFLGSIVGFFVLTLYLPIFKLGTVF